MEYVHYYQTQSEFNADYNGSGYTEPWVGYIEETSGTSYNKRPIPVTMRLYTYEEEWSETGYLTQAMWESATSGTPVETITFNSAEEFFNYHFVRTSPYYHMEIYLGSMDETYNNGWTYTGFHNDLTGNAGGVDVRGGGVQYVTINDLHSTYKPWVLDYVNEHGEIDLVYYAYDGS